MAKNLSSSINKIKRAKQQIYCCLERNNYIGISNWNNIILDNIKYLEDDVEIFLSNHEVYKLDKKIRLNTIYGIIIFEGELDKVIECCNIIKGVV